MQHSWPVILSLIVLLYNLAAGATGVQQFTRTVQHNGKAYALTGVVVDLRDPHIAVKVGLAAGQVGRTESLAGIAKRNKAIAAINGSFFDAYTKDPLKNPDMSLISGGRLIFKSDLGSLLGFDADNTPHLGIVRFKLFGTVELKPARPQKWYSYWINRKPTAATSVTLFTRQWGKTVEPQKGTSVVVDGGKVTAIQTDAAAIPEDGFVLHFRGDDSLLRRFQLGSTVDFAPEMQVKDGKAAEWEKVREAVGAGPRVLVNGDPVFDPKSEGFSDPKILTKSGRHSAAGFTKDGKLYLITCTARVSDLGHLLKALGCTNGINLDGGASSGLWHRGNYLTKPGRDISNALLVVEK